MSSTLQTIQTQLAELVALPSVSAVDPQFDMGNAAVVARLGEWFEAAGFTATEQTVSAAPDKRNLVARLGAGEGGLVLSGHTDT
ncbi:MAG: acetylornithine deacetylase, partial [Gammaproteobacteria bacterium]